VKICLPFIVAILHPCHSRLGRSTQSWGSVEGIFIQRHRTLASSRCWLMSGGRLHDDFTQEPISEVPGQSCSGESVTNFSPAFHARSSARRNSLRAFREIARRIKRVGRLSESPDRVWLQEMLQRMDPSSTRRLVDGAPLAHPLSDRCRPGSVRQEALASVRSTREEPSFDAGRCIGVFRYCTSAAGYCSTYASP
jgi:hypothetical protein